MFAEDTDILHAFDSGFARLCDGLVVDYTFLKPEVRNFETDHVFDDRWNLVGGPKDIHQVDASLVVFKGGGVRGLDVGIALEAVDLLECGIHGEDVIALHDEIPADVVAGAPGLVAHADHGDGLGAAEHFIDEGGIVHGSVNS